MAWLMMVLALASATPAPAERDIAVPAGTDWRHAATGLRLMPELAGLPRTALTDATQDEHDVTAQFSAPDHSLSATLYVFCPAIADVGLWFDSAQASLASSRTFRDAVPATADPVAFGAGEASAGSSLRQVYTTRGGRYRSTALAVVPVGDWVVSIQMNAQALTAAQLQVRLQQVIGAVRWPRPAGPAAPGAMPVQACPTALASPAASHAQPHPAWCRVGPARNAYGVYRSSATATGYVMTLNDTGGVVSIDRTQTGQDAGSGAYAVSLTDVDGTVASFPSFTSLPTPEQVWSMVEKGQPAGVATGGRPAPAATAD